MEVEVVYEIMLQQPEYHVVVEGDVFFGADDSSEEVIISLLRASCRDGCEEGREGRNDRLRKHLFKFVG